MPYAHAKEGTIYESSGLPNLKLTCVEAIHFVDPTLYRQLIGSLMYLLDSRLNICYVVNTLSQFMVEPCRSHWKVGTKRHLLSIIA